MVEGLNRICGVTCRMPSGAFYAFPNVRGVLDRQGAVVSPHEFANYLLKDAHVAVVPGEPFGSRDHIRLSYATGMDSIRKGLDRLTEAVGKLSA